jgi:serine/threonine protein phosphatase PrpC
MMSATPSATAAPAWRIEVGFLTDPGYTRTRNEDAYALYLPYAGEANPMSVDAVFAVADGLGGHAAGDVASRYVADAAVEALTSAAAEIPESSADLERWVEWLLRRINQELGELAQERAGAQGMGSTLTLAILRGSTLVLGHVGDTRCYRLRDGTLTQLTEDHSWVAEQRRAGLITEEEEERHPDRNVLTECLGTERLGRVFTLQAPVQEGDRYLLCSDGLHGPVTRSLLHHVLAEESDPQAAARQLIDLANRNGGPDNITALIFDLLPAMVPIAAPEPQLAEPEPAAAEPTEAVPEPEPAAPLERRSSLFDTQPNGLQRPQRRRAGHGRLLLLSTAAVVSLAAAGAWFYRSDLPWMQNASPASFAPEPVLGGETPLQGTNETERGPDPPPPAAEAAPIHETPAESEPDPVVPEPSPQPDVTLPPAPLLEPEN